MAYLRELVTGGQCKASHAGRRSKGGGFYCCLRTDGHRGFHRDSKGYPWVTKPKKTMSGARSSAAIIAESVTEAQVQASVRDKADMLGWTVFFTWNSRHSEKGDLDLRLIRPPRVVFIECKTEKGTLTPEQERTIKLLNGCPGVEVYIARPSNLEAIQDILQHGFLGHRIAEVKR